MPSTTSNFVQSERQPRHAVDDADALNGYGLTAREDRRRSSRRARQYTSRRRRDESRRRGRGAIVRGIALLEGENRRTLCVEGVIYPEGTIPDGARFVVTLDDAIGRWFCRGWLIIDDNRPEPHMNTDQQYFFGAVNPTEMFPADTLMSSGVEGALSDT